MEARRGLRASEEKPYAVEVLKGLICIGSVGCMAAGDLEIDSHGFWSGSADGKVSCESNLIKWRLGRPYSFLQMVYRTAATETLCLEFITPNQTVLLLFWIVTPAFKNTLRRYGNSVLEYGDKWSMPVLKPRFGTPGLRAADPGRFLKRQSQKTSMGWSRDSGLRGSRDMGYEVSIPSATQQILPRNQNKADIAELKHIFVRSTDGRHFCVQIWAWMTVLNLKKEIQGRLGFPATAQNLLFSGLCMQDHHTLQHYRVEKDSTVILNLRLRGGSKGYTSKPTGSYKDAAKGTGTQKGKEHANANTPPGQYIVDEAPESPSILLDIPEVKGIFTDLQKNAIICRFNGFWPRSDALYQWIHMTWTKNCRIQLCSKGFFIVVFRAEEERDKALTEGPWFWGSAGLFVTPWFPEFDPNSMVVSKMPVWVRLHNLPMHFWHFSSLAAIGNTLGRMLKIDTERHLKGIFTFARICVEVDLSQGLPESIILNFNNTQWKQSLDYENTAFRCRGCQQTGHLFNACKSQNKNKPQQRKHKGSQNIDNVIKKKTEEKKVPTVPEDAGTEEEEDDTIIEEVDLETQKETTVDNKELQSDTFQAETQQQMTSMDPSMGGIKRQHHSDTSDSDKETGQQNETTQLVIVSTEPIVGEWRKVEKKKGRKT